MDNISYYDGLMRPYQTALYAESVLQYRRRYRLIQREYQQHDLESGLRKHRLWI